MIRKVLITISLFFAVLSLAPLTASAQTGANPAACKAEMSGFLGFPTWYKYLSPRIEGGECKLSLPQDQYGKTDLGAAIAPVLLAIFEIILRIAGLVAVGFVIFGGFQYLTSQGEPDRIKGARSTIVNALIGLGIAVSATAIVNLVAGKIV